MIQTKPIAHRVGIAEVVFSAGEEQLKATGLGSCVAVVLFDESVSVAGMGHVMLPSSSIDQSKVPAKPGKFADTAVPYLCKKLQQQGAKHLKAKIAGGAQMFQFSNSNGQLNIGPRNVEAIKEQLKHCNIPLLNEHVGGHQGRTVVFTPKNSVFTIKLFQKGTFDI
ncbi:chemotaxis protein CheD [Aureibacillus halotolerans]|uniref:Probable chemoreceptor glutamine deamidase CheD n=1 Tax=Aureibacillus halotolerans TaxID=1508390 RepID=A0A4R6U139_9BACI|nr:chemotaxis protein CheD [Aureibacillus halotolerans]TDQ39671.1 chemotaxis protein CheD [Aureibacillus halotolerans]